MPLTGPYAFVPLPIRVAAMGSRPPRPTLFLICGLPGAGKTTFAQRLQDEIPAIRLCPDDWIAALDFPLHDEARRAKLEALFTSLAFSLLGQGQSVILEFGFWSRSERDAMRLTARALAVRVEMHYLQAPVDELWRRLQSRNRHLPEGFAPITHAQLLRFSGMFEPPGEAELDLFDSPSRLAP